MVALILQKLRVSIRHEYAPFWWYARWARRVRLPAQVGGWWVAVLRDQDSCIQIALDSWPLLPIVVCFFFSLVHVQCSLSFPSSLELSLWKKAREKAMTYEGSSVVEFFFGWSNHIFWMWFFMKIFALRNAVTVNIKRLSYLRPSSGISIVWRCR